MSREFIEFDVLDLYKARNNSDKKYFIGISEYQRKNRFDGKFIKKLFDSMINDLDIGQILLHNIEKKIRNKDVYMIIDGRQRIGSIVSIINNPSQIYMSKLKKLENKSFLQKKLILDSKIEEKITKKIIIRSRNIRKEFEELQDKDIITKNFKKTILKMTEIMSDNIREKYQHLLFKIYDSVKNDFVKFFNYKISICSMRGSPEKIIETFKRRNTEGTHLLDCELLSASWTMYKYVKPYTKKIKEIMNKRLNEIVDDDIIDDAIIDVDINEDDKKNKCSIYYYLVSIENYLCKYSTWKVLRKKDDDSKFNLICDVIMQFYDIDNIYEIPEFILKSKTKDIEKDLIKIMEEFEKLKEYNKFSKVVSHNPIKIDDLLEYIEKSKINKDYNYENVIFDNILRQLKIDENSYDKMKQGILNYLKSNIDDKTNKLRMTARCLLYFLDKKVLETKNEISLTQNEKSFINYYFDNNKTISEMVNDIMDDINEKHEIIGYDKIKKERTEKNITEKKIIVKKKNKLDDNTNDNGDFDLFKKIKND